MMPWIERSIEERTLINPAFCAMILWHAAQGYSSERSLPMPIELSFLVLPFALHKQTRESLPTSIRTSLPTWLSNHPVARARLGGLASTLCAFTKESLVFGGLHGLLSIALEGVRANANMKNRVNTVLQATSDEVRACAKRAEFLGRWLEKAGSPETVMAMLGVRP